MDVKLRNALGRFATGVCLITTTTEEDRPLALTANSFAAVSLDPPLVLWSLQNGSEVYRDYAGAQYFNINVLSSEQREHSNDYARKGDQLIKPEHFTPGTFGALGDQGRPGDLRMRA